jgi:IS1 family transposase
VVKFGKNSVGRQRFRCVGCKKTFVETHAFSGKRTDEKTACRALLMLLEGMAVRAVSRLTGLDPHTILDLMVAAGEQCATFMETAIRDVNAETVEIDEQWSFIRLKERTIRVRGGAILHDEGDCYTFTAMDRHTKLLLCYHVGKRDGQHTQVFADKLHASIVGRPTIFSDGFGPYTTIIPETWDGNCDFAQIVKSFVTPPKKEQQKYYPAAIIRVEKKEVCGTVEKSEIGTSRMERFNLSSRMHVRRLTRLTNAHSKTLTNHKAMLALWFAFYNFCRKHLTLKTTPAVAAGIAAEPWSLERLLTEAAKTIAA